MSLTEFQKSLELIKSFAYKLGREDIPLAAQKILLKTYAHDLNINLSSNMIELLLS